MTFGKIAPGEITFLNSEQRIMTGTTSPAVEENSIDKSENPEQYNDCLLYTSRCV